MPDEPMKLQITPEGAAGMFLRYRLGGEATKEAQDALAELFREYWMAGYQVGLEEAREKDQNRD